MPQGSFLSLQCGELSSYEFIHSEMIEVTLQNTHLTMTQEFL